MKECFKKKCENCFNHLEGYVLNEDYEELVVGKINKTHIYNISSILALISLISGFLFVLLNVYYKMRCRDYFGIPPKYFSYDFKSMFIEALLKSLAWIICYLILYYIYYLLKKEKIFKNIKEVKIFFLFLIKIFSIVLVFIWFFSIIYIVIYIILEIDLDTSIFTILFLLFISSIFIYFLEKKKILLSKSFIFLNTFLAFMLIFFIRFETIHPENDKNYEVTIVKIDKKDEQVVVLSNSNDKCLVVKYEEKDGEAIFYTKKYYFINRENKEFSIKNFKNKSIDKKSDKNNVTKNLNNKSKM